jgi:hypothetical protein
LNSNQAVQNFLIIDNYQSPKVFVMKFLSDINQETAAKIDAFVSSRLGVISSSTNFTTKVISITVDERLGKNEVDFIFNSVRKKFLGPEDAPQHVNCKH